MCYVSVSFLERFVNVNFLIKCDLMACWLNVAVVGLPPLAKSVAVAIAKTPQSFIPSCFGPSSTGLK